MHFTSLLIMLVLISLLVLVHEFGHYIMARAFNIKVTKFGIGMPFGPVLYRTKKGDLEILIHAFLFGGYVSFPEDDPDSKEQINPDESFKNKPPLQRAIVLVAGVFMNVVFAFFLIVLAALIFHKLPTSKSDVYINDVIKGSYVDKVAPDLFKKGDKILSVNGFEIKSPQEFIFYIKNSKKFDGKVLNSLLDKKAKEIIKLNQSIDFLTTVPKGTKLNLPASMPEEPLMVKAPFVIELGKDDKNETKLSDEAVFLRGQINGNKTYVLDKDYSLTEIASAVADTYRPVNIDILRNGEIISNKNIVVPEDGVFGVSLNSVEIYAKINNLKDMFVQSVKYMILSSKAMLIGLWLLISGQIPLSDMHGIVAITKIGSDVIQTQGMLNGLLLTAVISLDLAIFNLLPIPALDGGHLMFIIIEKILGRKLDEKAVSKIESSFFIFLMLLIVLITFNDILALILKKF